MLLALFRRVTAYPRVAVAAFFAMFFLVGVVAFWGYGVSWDEPNMYRVGQRAYEYVFHGAEWPTEKGLRYYGTVFELPAAIIDRLVAPTDESTVVLLKHFLTFCTFFLGTWFFYLLGKKIFSSRWMGLLGALLLVLSPRIFADAFYNSKDLPNLAFFTIAIYTLVRFLEKKNWLWAMFHALATALAIGMRLTSLLIPLLTVFFFTIQSLQEHDTTERQNGKRALILVLYFVLTGLCTIAVWPFLWENPIGHLREAYQFMSTIGVDTFYMGKQIGALPWHYVFVWIGITTPLLYTFFFLLGLSGIAVSAARHPLQWLTHKSEQGIVCCWFFLPILAVYVTGAGIFDGWRHLYFVYPAFLLIALFGMQLFLHVAEQIARKHRKNLHTFLPLLFTVLIAIHSLWIAAWMVRNHPLQNMYFSIPARYVSHNFELDYWGLSFRPAMEYLLKTDPSPTFTVWPSTSPGHSTWAILPPEQRGRIRLALPSQATYALINYRTYQYNRFFPFPLVHSIVIDGVDMLGIYRLRNAAGELIPTMPITFKTNGSSLLIEALPSDPPAVEK